MNKTLYNVKFWYHATLTKLLVLLLNGCVSIGELFTKNIGDRCIKVARKHYLKAKDLYDTESALAKES